MFAGRPRSDTPVIPMGAVPPQYQLAGAPPPEAAQDFARLKYAVLAMGGTTAGRFIFSIPAGLLPGDFMNVLGIVFAFCIGSYLQPRTSTSSACMTASPRP
ncbi:unnamed protein product [Prorocentrum cordatum]|uniref:Uncharacterized protein n=1 Tax=Prorocentrum cordatum TaxID=2364126 RepID=A0ABN9R4S2_9DINO|nr:unnamed protein product [Polarella glacialis]